jgi:N-acetylglucosaminyl-diphospho-decaprenol L-rhamnosyltransferase
MTRVDVVVVAYNSADKLARCLSSVSRIAGTTVTVVDNASQDASLDVVAGFDATAISLDWNSGFAHGCNVGWRAGSAPLVLFLNPDAAIEAESLTRLASRLEQDPSLGIVAPRIVHEDGSQAHSLRRYPSLRRAFAQAFFLHRVAPSAGWADEVIRDATAYVQPGSPDWLSGACLLVRRSVLEELDGWDERFFLYSEDVDLCRRAREAGAGIAYEPSAVCVHTGGASAPRGSVLPLMATSRQAYALKHERRPVAILYSIAIGVSSLTHALLAPDRERRRGHLRAVAQLAARRSTIDARPAGQAR